MRATFLLINLAGKSEQPTSGIWNIKHFYHHHREERTKLSKQKEIDRTMSNSQPNLPERMELNGQMELNGVQPDSSKGDEKMKEHLKCFKLSSAPVNVNVNVKANAYSSRDRKRARPGKARLVTLAQKYDEKNINIGLGEMAAKEMNFHGDVEEHEFRVREQQRSFLFTRFFTTLMAACMVFFIYLITLETLLSCALCVGLTIFWYREYGPNDTWNGSSMDFVVLGFAVVTPLTVTITLAFQRRERALYEISRIRSLCFQIYLAHAIWYVVNSCVVIS